MSSTDEAIFRHLQWCKRELEKDPDDERRIKLLKKIADLDREMQERDRQVLEISLPQSDDDDELYGEIC